MDEAEVARRRHTLGALETKNPHAFVVEGAELARRPANGSVVDDDDLNVDPRLSERAREGGSQKQPPVAAWDLPPNLVIHGFDARRTEQPV